MNPFGSALTFPHFSHITNSNGSWIGINTLILASDYIIRDCFIRHMSVNMHSRTRERRTKIGKESSFWNNADTAISKHVSVGM